MTHYLTETHKMLYFHTNNEYPPLLSSAANTEENTVLILANTVQILCGEVAHVRPRQTKGVVLSAY
jgi:hypothetical protein